MIDYRKYYHLERYLFDEVSATFQATGNIEPADFYLIVIWKANRAKSKIKKKLIAKAGSFSAGVEAICQTLCAAPNAKARLNVLLSEWGFRLPMATAILTVLYPNEFTVYDIRVCDVLNAFHGLDSRAFSDALWSEYNRYIDAVRAAVPMSLDLRDMDRYLWGRSLYEQVLLEVA
jgi:hypothetical protein